MNIGTIAPLNPWESLGAPLPNTPLYPAKTEQSGLNVAVVNPYGAVVPVPEGPDLSPISANNWFYQQMRRLWLVTVPSPYAATNFNQLSAKVQQQIVSEGQQAAWTAMTVAQRAQFTHPSIVSIPGGFNGFRYWMAYTPYPNANPQFENPCVVASNDGIQWVVPVGLENPIAPSPPGPEYNADTHLYYDRARNRLVLMWVSRNDSTLRTFHYVSVSGDGVNWTAPVVVWSGNVAANNTLGSPSLWFDTATQLWTMVGHNLDGVGGWPFVRLQSPDLFSGWPATPTTLRMPHPVPGRRWWHSHFQQLPSGEIVGVVQDNNGSVGNPGFVYLSRSINGIDFGVQLCSGTAESLYRPSWCPSLERDADVLLVFSEITGANIRLFKTIFQGAQPGEFIRRKVLAALQAPRDGLSFCPLVDDFNRADAAALGTSSGGQVWTQQDAGNTVGILSNCATNSTTGNCRAHFDVGQFEYTISLVVANAPVNGDDWIILRWQDASNFIRARIIGTPPNIQEIVAGSATQIGTAANAVAAPGSVVSIENTRDRIRYYVDGVLYMDLETTRFQNATRVGLQMSGATGIAKVNAFTVTPV